MNFVQNSRNATVFCLDKVFPGGQTSIFCRNANFEIKESVLLIGDSHAQAESIAVQEVVEELGAQFYYFSMSSCPFYLTVNADISSNFPLFSPDCVKHNIRILTWIKVHTPNVIVYSHKSSRGYLTNKSEYSVEIFNDFLARNLANLNNLTDKVVVISPVPQKIYPINFAEILFKKGAVDSKEPLFDRNFWLKESEVKNYDFVDTVSIFCPAGKCVIANEIGRFYSDDNHLSYLGAQKLVEDIKKYLSPIITGTN